MQLRGLVNACINPDPERRCDITYVSNIARQMYARFQQQMPQQ